eukprot:48116_1
MITIYEPNKSVVTISSDNTSYPSILSKTNLNEVHKAIQYLREFYETDLPQISQLFNDAILSHMHALLQLNNYPQIQHKVLWILINVLFRYKKYTKQLLHADGINQYANLLQLPSYPIQHHTLWILGIIAGDCIESRNKVINCILPHILTICGSEFDKTLCQQYGELPQQWTKVIAMSMFVIYRLCNKGKHIKDNKQQLLNMIQLILMKHSKFEELYTNKDNNSLSDDVAEIRSQIVWSIYALLNKKEFDIEFIDILFNKNILEKLIYFLYSNDNHTILGVIRIFVSILKYNDLDNKYISRCIEINLLECINVFMNKYTELLISDMDEKMLIIEEICWLLSEIASHSMETVKLLNKNGLLTICIKLIRMKYDNECDIIGKYALMIIRNAIANYNDKYIIECLVNNDLIEGLCEYGQQYELNDIEEDSIRNILECFESIFIHCNNDNQYTERFRLCGGLKLLYLMQEDVVDGIFTLNEWKANNIINTYYNVQKISYNNNDNNWFTFDMKYIKEQQSMSDSF